jgi:hypothetical protein
MLFVNKKTAKGLTPSVSRQVFVGRSVPGPLAKAVSSTNRSRLAAELAALGAASSTAPAAGPGTAGRAALQGRSATSTASVAAPVARRLPAPSAKGVAFDPVALIGRELQLPLWPAVGLLALAMALAGVWRQSTRSEAGRIPPKGS